MLELDEARRAFLLRAALTAVAGAGVGVVPASLAQSQQHQHGGTVQLHTRSSILQRMFSHDAYHCGELSQTLGIHDLPQIDLWRQA